MSLATRCTACGTIFRVVQDQLRVSEGWVRCGRCAEVFDAREQLFDIDREAPPPWPPGQAEETRYEEASAAPEPAPPAPPPPEQTTWQQPREPEPEVEIDLEPVAERAPPPDSRLDLRPEPQWIDEDTLAAGHVLAKPNTEARGAADAAEPMLMGQAPDVVFGAGLAGIDNTSSTPAISAELPSFLRDAPNPQRWRQPAVRIALGAAAALLLILLGLQTAQHFHDALATLFPGARPSLQALCQVTDCKLQPWARIDAVGVESSALSQASSGNHYKLTVSLHNKSNLEVATPWIDLSLTDAAGAVLARRMLSPADFKAAPSAAALPAGADLPLNVLLSTGEQKVSGYLVEIFHP